MNQITKTLLLTALAAGLSSQAAARDVHHRWCAEEAPVAQPVVAAPPAAASTSRWATHPG